MSGIELACGHVYESEAAVADVFASALALGRIGCAVPSCQWGTVATLGEPHYSDRDAVLSLLQKYAPPAGDTTGATDGGGGGGETDTDETATTTATATASATATPRTPTNDGCGVSLDPSDTHALYSSALEVASSPEAWGGRSSFDLVRQLQDESYMASAPAALLAPLAAPPAGDNSSGGGGGDDDNDDDTTATLARYTTVDGSGLRVSIGCHGDAASAAVLDGLSTGGVVNCAVQAKNYFAGDDGSVGSEPARYEYVFVNLVDDPSQDLPLAQAVDSLTALLESVGEDKTVFVHCLEGKSRSVSVVLAWLMTAFPWLDVDAALAHVQRTRPMAQPNEGFMAQLRVYHDNLHAV